LEGAAIFVSVSNVQSLTLRFTDGPVLLPRVAIHSKRGRKWEKMDHQFTSPIGKGGIHV